MTAISVPSSTSSQQVWAADPARIVASFTNTGPDVAYLKVGSAPTTSFGGYDFALGVGASVSAAIATAPEIVEPLYVIWSSAATGKGLSGSQTRRESAWTAVPA